MNAKLHEAELRYINSRELAERAARIAARDKAALEKEIECQHEKKKIPSV